MLQELHALTREWIGSLRACWLWIAAVPAVFAPVMIFDVFVNGHQLDLTTGNASILEATAMLVVIVICVVLPIPAVVAIFTSMMRAAVRQRFSDWYAAPFIDDALRVALIGFCFLVVSSAAAFVLEVGIGLVPGAEHVLRASLGRLLGYAINGGLSWDAGIRSSGQGPFLDGVNAVASALVTAWLSARFAPAIAGSIAQRKLILFDAWRWTRGRWGPTFVLMVLVTVPVEIIAGLNDVGSGEGAMYRITVYVSAMLLLMAVAAQMIVGVSVWRRVAPKDALAAATWRPDGETARLLPVAGLDEETVRTTS